MVVVDLVPSKKKKTKNEQDVKRGRKMSISQDQSFMKRKKTWCCLSKGCRKEGRKEGRRNDATTLVVAANLFLSSTLLLLLLSCCDIFFVEKPRRELVLWATVAVSPPVGSFRGLLRWKDAPTGMKMMLLLLGLVVVMVMMMMGMLITVAIPMMVVVVKILTVEAVVTALPGQVEALRWSPGREAWALGIR